MKAFKTSRPAGGGARQHCSSEAKPLVARAKPR